MIRLSLQLEFQHQINLQMPFLTQTIQSLPHNLRAILLPQTVTTRAEQEQAQESRLIWLSTAKITVSSRITLLV